MPNLNASGRAIVAAVEVSVMPQPSRIRTPAASKNRRISGLIGAAPVTQFLMLPPNSARIFESTCLSANSYCLAQQEADGLAGALALADLLADADRPVEDAFLRPPSFSTLPVAAV